MLVNRSSMLKRKAQRCSFPACRKVIPLFQACPPAKLVMKVHLALCFQSRLMIQKISYKHTQNHVSACNFGNIICKGLETKVVHYMYC